MATWAQHALSIAVSTVRRYRTPDTQTGNTSIEKYEYLALFSASPAYLVSNSTLYALVTYAPD